MNHYDIYTLVLCLIVFALLVSLSVIFLKTVVKQTVRLIRLGAEDEAIKTEYEKNLNKKKGMAILERILSCLFSVIFIIFFSVSMFFSCTENTYHENFPTVKVVQTASMEKKNPKNTYLFTNNLNNQISTFDLILTYQVPDEMDLQIYDIVVYEVDEILLVHRIVNIEEPNEKHPNERWFLCQGDAVESPDRFPVRYEQIKGIYRGEKIPFVGSFVMFMQSPAGWLCVFLVLAFTICTPIIEKKINKEKNARLISMGAIEEVSVTDTITEKIIDNQNQIKFNFSTLSKNRDNRTFIERLNDSAPPVKERYETIIETISRIAGARVIQGKKQHTYKSGNVPIARLTIKGKTLNAYLGLNPSEYEDSKYIFVDSSNVKAYANYPMRVKLTSNRQTKWTQELITELCTKNGLILLEKPRQIIVEEQEKWFSGLSKRDNRTFKERLERSSDLVKERYNVLTELLLRIEGVRVIDAKKTETFKKGNVPIARLTIKGKTLNAYLGLNPSEYEDSKYIFVDSSSVKAYANYPMRVKLTSNRQTKWTQELITELCAKNGLILLEKRVEKKEFSFDDLKKKKVVPFKQKLKKCSIAKERYLSIRKVLTDIDGVRAIESIGAVTYKKGNTPIVRFTIRGKTLNAYIGLSPKAYENTKYIFTDVSSVKKYANYPMRVKVTSSRQVRWIIELINAITCGVEL